MLTGRDRRVECLDPAVSTLETSRLGYFRRSTYGRSNERIETDYRRISSIPIMGVARRGQATPIKFLDGQNNSKVRVSVFIWLAAVPFLVLV